jgi:hypothetical protein
MNAGYTFAELCAVLGKSSFYVYNIQKNLSLPVLKAEAKYSVGYKTFLANIINLKTLGVSNEDIIRLLELEKKILHLLQVDSLNNAPTWYLDHCVNRYARHRTKSFILLLTDYELDDSPLSQSSQGSLDFTGAQRRELFKSAEMGEDINRAVEKYRELEGKILGIMEGEVAVTQRASDWARHVLSKKR